MKNKKLIAISIGLLLSTLSIPVIASTYENFELTKGQIEFINFIDSSAGTNFISLVNTPNANRIISSATFACGYKDFQRKIIIAAGGDEKISKKISNKFESLFCDHVLNVDNGEF